MRPVVPALLLAVAFATPVVGESAVRLPYPERFGTVPASTYDGAYHRIGTAHLVIEKLDDGNVRMFSESGFDGGARTVLRAELEAVQTDTGPFLRPVLEESRSFDPQGTPLGTLSVDHRARRGTCTPAAGKGEPEIVELPEGDRVVNVPLNLLFEPIVKGDAEKVEFQILMCRFGGRLLDFEASLAPHQGNGNGNGHPGQADANAIVRVQYKPNLGGFVNFVAGGYLPVLSFWFDPRAPNPWVAHRVPLYMKGPEVYVVREGVPVSWLDGAPPPEKD